MSTFFISYETVPAKGHHNEQEFGGAIINGWIVAPSIEAADAQFKNSTLQQGWSVTSEEKSFEILDGNYEEGDEGLQYYQQAQIDGEVYFVHSWERS